MHGSRAQGAKIVFLTFRQQTHTLQGVMAISKDEDEHQVSKQMLKYATSVPVGSSHRSERDVSAECLDRVYSPRRGSDQSCRSQELYYTELRGFYSESEWGSTLCDLPLVYRVGALAHNCSCSLKSLLTSPNYLSPSMMLPDPSQTFNGSVTSRLQLQELPHG